MSNDNPAAPTATPDLNAELGFWVIPIDVRRAVLGVFFRAGGGTYRLLIGKFSESTRWRCLHWRQAAHQRNQRPRWGDRVVVPPPAAPPPPVP